MHGRARLSLALVVLALGLPATASADPMPAGTYDVNLNGGSATIGSFLPALPLPPVSGLVVPIGNQPVNVSLPAIADIPGTIDASVAVGTISGTYTITVPTSSLSIDPSNGSATIDLTFYGSVSLTLTGLVTLTANCSIGDSTHPIPIHLTTDSGAPWSANTGNFGLADNTFAVPSPVCDNANIQSILTFLLGNTGSGNNTALVTGNAARRANTTPQPSTTTSTTTSPPAAGSEGTGSTPTGTPPTTNTAAPRSCIVPKLKGKSTKKGKPLKRLKGALKKSGCRLGKVRKAKSKKRKGTVLRQKPKPGTKLPAGSKVTLVVARGR